MLGRTSTRLEIDVLQQSEIMEASRLAHVYNMPALVVHPDLASAAAMQRGRQQGRYKIIVAVGRQGDKEYGVRKFHGLHTDALTQDGFEILISPHDSTNKARDEMREVIDFIQHHLSSIAEFRVVLGALSRELSQWEPIAEAIKNVPSPTLVRTDNITRIQQTKANAVIQNGIIDTIRRHTRCPVKVSGNISNLNMMSEVRPDRYAVNLSQMNSIISNARKYPNKLKELSKKLEAPVRSA